MEALVISQLLEDSDKSFLMFPFIFIWDQVIFQG